MDISGIESRPELSEHRPRIRTRFSPLPRECRRRRRVLVSFNANIGRDQQVQRRMLCPVGRHLFDLKKRHFIYDWVTVATHCGEEPVNLYPGVPSRRAMFVCDPSFTVLAPGWVSGAGASPIEVSLTFKPDPVSTAFRTEAALPRSSKFSTCSSV